MTRVDIAKILLRRPDGKYLILRNSEWPERPDRSLQPDLPGGLVENRESHLAGVLRETEEEAGVSLKEDEVTLVYAESFTDMDKAINRLIYFAETPIDHVELSWEHDKYWWMSTEEILKLEMREPYPKIFKYLSETGILV